MTFFAPLVHPPGLLRRLYPEAYWRMDGSSKSVFITFDDGPIPIVTPWILERLDEANAKATFFCVGENVERNPEIYEDILKQGHAVGNHTFNHMQGLKSNDEEFYQNIDKAARLIQSNLFRPPHGFMSFSQYRHISQKYKIIMWDILSRDYDPAVKPSKILDYINRYIQNGSIITFHDSTKTYETLHQTLPLVIKMLKDEGYQLEAIPFYSKEQLLLHPLKNEGIVR